MKKVLSIVLSVAMVICLMPAMAFAADSNSTAATGLSKFSDASSITNKEAVSVLVGLGVINGRGDGTFDPKGDVTRAETSTLVSILVRSGDSSSLSAPSKDPFTDVAKDNWAAPYVAYGVSQGYLNGRGDGTFDPTGNVTTAQLATILDQILGYTKADVAYQWPENAMSWAQTAGLLTGISKGANDNLDREEAAQMIFNALKANTRVKATTTGENGENSYKDITNATESTKTSVDYRGDSKLDPSDEQSEYLADTVQQLVEKLFPKVTCEAKSADDFGRTSTAWMNGRTQISDDVTETPAYTYTAAQTEKALNSDLKDYTLKNVPVYSNSDKESDSVDSVSGIADCTGNGVLVELYTNAKDTAITKAVVVTYTPMTVLKSANNTIELAKDAHSTSADVILKSTDAGYDAVKAAVEGDRVLVALGGANKNKVLDAYLATSVSGVVSKSTKSTVTINGTDYGKAAEATDAAKNLEAGTAEKTVYLDKYGYVVDTDDVKTVTSAADYVYVTAVRGESSTTADPYLNDSTPTMNYHMMAIDENGNVLSDVQLADYSKLSDKAKEGAVDPSTLGKVDGGKFTFTSSNAGAYAYVQTADGYILYSKDASGKSDKVPSTGPVTANQLKIDNKYVSSSAKTVSYTANGSKVTASVSNGVSAIAEKTPYTYIVKNDRVTTVFVVASSSTENPDVIYVAGETGTSQNFTDAQGVLRTGVVVTYYEAGSSEAKTMTVRTAPNVGFYTAAANGEGYTLTPATVSNGGNSTVASVYADNNAITLADGTVATLADGAIRDTRTGEADKITTAAQLAAAGNVSVTYVKTIADNGAVTITQLYIK